MELISFYSVSDEEITELEKSLKDQPYTDEFTFTALSDGSYRADKYAGSYREVTVPDHYQGRAVTQVGRLCFAGHDELRCVYLPDSVKYINKLAFADCSSLEEVTLPDGLNLIGEYAFLDCRKLSSVYLPSGVFISGTAFSGCTVQCFPFVPEEKEKEPESAPNGPATESTYFAYIQPPRTLGQNGKNTVSSSRAAAVNTIPSGSIPDVLSQSSDPGHFEYVLLENETIMLTKYGGREKTVRVPRFIDSYAVTVTGKECFINNKAVEKVIVPKGIRKIENDAFRSCLSLENIDLPETISVIGDNVFESCGSLKELILPPRIKKIGASLCMNCGNLDKLVIPRSVSKISKSAFEHCVSLREVQLPGVVDIGQSAFAYCGKLSSVSFAPIIQVIRKNAFKHCSSLGDLIFPSELRRIEEGAFESCTSLGNVLIPETTAVDGFAFSKCYAINIMRTRGMYPK